MKYSITDNSFIKKVLSRKLRRNIAVCEYDMEWLSFDRKVEFASQKMKSITFDKAKMLISFWEPNEKMRCLMKDYANWTILREYKGHPTTGLLEVNFNNKIDSPLLDTIIRKHYGYELGKTNVLDIDLVLAFEDKNKIKICHLYDDRGFRIYEMERS